MQAYVNQERDAVAVPMHPDGVFVYRDTMCCVDLRNESTRLVPIYRAEQFREFLDYTAVEIPDSLGDIVVRYACEAIVDKARGTHADEVCLAVLDGAAEIITMSHV